MQVKARLAVQQHLSLQWLHRSPVYLQIYFHKKSFFFKLLYIFRVRVKAVAAAPSLESGSPPILLLRRSPSVTDCPSAGHQLTPRLRKLPKKRDRDTETQGRKRRREKREKRHFEEKRVGGDMWQVGAPTAQVFTFFIYCHFKTLFQPQYYFSNQMELKSVAVILLSIA